MMTPFIRWAGGKSKIISSLLRYVPKEYNNYWEPFLGAGSMFFALKPDYAILSDLNKHLIQCYNTVKEHPKEIHYLLQKYSKKTSESYYYKTRERYNNSNSKLSSTEKSALFIYLNKTCFNGIFRVNMKGEFNVPYGHKNPPAIPSKEHLIGVSNVLKKTEIYSDSFENVLKHAKKDDFVYLDPPYPPLNGTSFFTHYTKERFGDKDQLKVLEAAQALDSRCCKVMISNADTELTRNLFKDWNIVTLPVTRWITCKKKKHKVNEIVIFNY